MNINSAFPSKYVKASDLNGNKVVTIDRVEIELVGDDEEKPVLYFRESEKGLVLNKTNGTAIAQLYGTETDDWPGKKITIFPTQTDFGGKPVECIRVRMRAPQSEGQDAGSSDVPF